VTGHGRRSSFSFVFALLGAAVVVFVVLPIIVMAVGTPPGRVAGVFRQRDAVSSLWLTLEAGLTAAAVAFVGGVPLAYLLARREFPGKRLVEGLLDVPIVFPHTAAGIALLMVYGRDGIVGRLLAPFGIHFTDSFAGIVVAMMFVSLPFLVDTAREAFALVDPRYELVARTLGVSPAAAFARTALPLAWRGVFTGAVMMWARGISEFGAVVILAYNPKVAPVLVFERFEGFGLRAAEPLAVVIAALALGVFIVLRLLVAPQRARTRRAGGGA
jgi:molybdate/tungstate transport system permease protein